EMSIEAVVGEVGLAAHEPAVEGRFLFVEHLRPRFEPVQLPGNFPPECLRIAQALAMHAAILVFGAEHRMFAKLLGGFEATGFLEHRFELFDVDCRHERIPFHWRVRRKGLVYPTVHTVVKSATESHDMNQQAPTDRAMKAWAMYDWANSAFTT